MKIGFGAQLWLMDNHYENFHRMLDEMALIGFDGFEVCYPFLIEWYEHRPTELQRLLQMHGLEFSSYYTGISFGREVTRLQGIEEFKRRCRFTAAVGGSYMLLDGGDKQYHQEFSSTHDYIACIAETANALGEYARSLGLTMAWHQHWGSIFEVEQNLHDLMKATDPSVVGLCCDVAQILISGFDPIETVKCYLDRIRFMHYKDAVRAGRPQGELWPGYTLPADEGAYGVDSKWRMVELGRGAAPLREVTAVLLAGGYDGWLVDDYDYSGYAAQVSAQACKDYINRGLGIWGERDLRECRNLEVR
jgi:sugar phosphate isomerase/epimerase